MDYVGTELALFAEAVNWKSYLASQMRPFIQGRVLEVGAGMGANIPILCNDRVSRYLAVEPDPNLSDAIGRGITAGALPRQAEVFRGTLADLSESERFDCILYVDVLEHIENDRQEVERAARHLAPGGHLMVLAPAHQFLFSPFDRSVGHFRRYDRTTLGALRPKGCGVVRARMLDSAGFLLSLGNRLLTRAAMPTKAQIRLWDRLFVALSRALDPLGFYRLGKSILMVWRAGSGMPPERTIDRASAVGDGAR